MTSHGRRALRDSKTNEKGEAADSFWLLLPRPHWREFETQVINRLVEVRGTSYTNDAHRGVPQRLSCRTARKKVWTLLRVYRNGRSKH